jgi:hypothetical protein
MISPRLELKVTCSSSLRPIRGERGRKRLAIV